jgi:hypothetical protein
MESEHEGDDHSGVQEIIDRLMEIRDDIVAPQETVQDLRKEQTECRNQIQTYMTRQNTGTFEGVHDTHNITLYNSWAQQSLNKAFLEEALAELVKEKGAKITNPQEAVAWILEYKHSKRTKVVKLTVRARPKRKSDTDVKRDTPKRRKINMDDPHTDTTASPVVKKDTTPLPVSRIDLVQL